MIETRNFKTHEFECPCCGKAYIIDRLPAALQELRDVLKTPIDITSGYRCPTHNAAIGGARHSMHLAGLAADCVFPRQKLFNALLEALRIPDFEAGGVGIYPPWRDDKGEPHGNFLHLDVRRKRARWGRYHGVYIPYTEALNMLDKS